MFKTKIVGNFWREYQNLVKDVVIPYQHEILWDRVPDAEPSYAVRNFQIAAGKVEGEFGGMVFQDSDIAKWIEAAAYSLANFPDKELEAKVDEIVDIVSNAQQEDGYLNTYFIINGLDKRFKNLVECHELYCLGHFIEAAVAYYSVTKKDKLLNVIIKYVDLVDKIFGTEEGKIKGYPGHQVIEMALIKLYEITKDEKHLKLAVYFLEERGKRYDGKHFFHQEWEQRDRKCFWGANAAPNLDYNQAALPVKEQTQAVGHAVRATYMYTGMASSAVKTGDPEMIAACKRLFNNIADKQLYITGGIGQTSIGEAFTYDYDLPNDTVYSETCAAIGLIFFAYEMLALDKDAKYADVMESALYNTVLAGMAKDGKHFFYVNPLEVSPEASKKSPIKQHIIHSRPGWYVCACCPPNVARLIMSLNKYIYTVEKDSIYVNLFIDSESKLDINGQEVSIKQSHNFPWEGDIKITISECQNTEFTLALRNPFWSKNTSVKINGNNAEYKELNGFIYINRKWNENDEIKLTLDMKEYFVASNPKVRANTGKAALRRGPHVYCLESIDNGDNLGAISVDITSATKSVFDINFLEGAYKITASGSRITDNNDKLYFDASEIKKIPAELTFVPYYLWNNRGDGEMSVWVNC